MRLDWASCFGHLCNMEVNCLWHLLFRYCKILETYLHLVIAMMSGYGISCEYHMTSILLELSMTSWRCTEASEKEVYGRSYNFPWDPLDYVEIPVKRKSVGNPGTSTGTLWVMLRSPWSEILKKVLGLPMRPSWLCGYPREEKYKWENLWLHMRYPRLHGGIPEEEANGKSRNCMEVSVKRSPMGFSMRSSGLCDGLGRKSVGHPETSQ